MLVNQTPLTLLVAHDWPGTGLRGTGLCVPMMGSWNSALVFIERGLDGIGPGAPGPGDGTLPTLWLRRLTGPMGREGPLP
jgi:hypothetical protein